MSAATLAPPDVQSHLAAADGHRPGLLDVRSPAEYETARIPGSVNIPLDRLDEVADRLAGLDRPLVTVCRTGQRSQQAQQRLLAAGADEVHVLDGGLQAWQREGGDVARGEPRWELERQVRLVAGSLVLGGIVGSKLVDERFKYLSGAVGAGLSFAALSNTCMMGNLLAKLPYNRGPGADVDAALEELGA